MNNNDPQINQNNIKYSLSDILKSGLAIFSLKYASLLQFCKDSKNPLIVKNIKSLFNISNIPSDTQLRDVIDTIPYESFRPAFDAILSSMQHGNELQKFTILGHYAIAIDGTGYFSSSTIKCKHCLTKKVKNQKTKNEIHEDEDEDREIMYHHQILAASIIHPVISQVIPLFPEPILNEDGMTKNDCERNASKRLIAKFRQHHPKMPVIIIEDSLFTIKKWK